VDNIGEQIVCLITVGKLPTFGMKTVRSSPGLYYQREDTASLYISEWKAVTGLSLQVASNMVDATGKHIVLNKLQLFVAAK
jgi:hypothetical protein